MYIKTEAKLGIPKKYHSEQWATQRSGYRVRRFNTILGLMYLLVKKQQRGGYILPIKKKP